MHKDAVRQAGSSTSHTMISASDTCSERLGLRCRTWAQRVPDTSLVLSRLVSGISTNEVISQPARQEHSFGAGPTP